MIFCVLFATVGAVAADDWCSEFLKRGKFQPAIEACSNDISKGGGSLYNAYNNRGQAYFKKGLYDKARDDFSSAIKIDPKNPKAYINRGLTQAVSANYEDAEKDIMKALEIDRHSTVSFMAVVELYALQNKTDSACLWLRRAVETGDRYLDYLWTQVALINVRESSCFQDILSGK